MLHELIAAALAANWHFYMYGALTGILFLRAFRSLKAREHHEARENGVEGLIHMVLALLHLL